MKRYKQSRGKSAAKFRSDLKTTKAANIGMMPMRGGWRL